MIIDSAKAIWSLTLSSRVVLVLIVSLAASKADATTKSLVFLPSIKETFSIRSFISLVALALIRSFFPGCSKNVSIKIYPQIQ